MAHGSDLPNPYTFCLRLNLCAMGKKKQKKFFWWGVVVGVPGLPQRSPSSLQASCLLSALQRETQE